MTRLKVVLASVVVAISLSLVACSSEVALDASDGGRELKVSVGSTLVVTLESNPTTGYKWGYEEGVSDTLIIHTGIPDETVLRLIEQKFVEPVAGAHLGAGGEEVWTFKAVGKGKTELSMEYSEPWEGGIKAAKTFRLTIVVE
jgi:inhibitor of cysteine peptidase